MESWWGRVVTRVRGQMGWNGTSMGPNGTLSLVAQPEAPRCDAHPRPGAWSWVKERLSLHRLTPRSQVHDAVERLTQICEMLEQHVSRQEARMNDIASAVRELSAAMALVPSTTMAQKHHMEQL